MNKAFIDTLPLVPGVYLFKNAAHQVIYIGKAKILRNRLRSYLANAKKDWKIKALLDEHASVDYIVTHSEIEALLLEAQLIGQHKPKYNVLLTAGNPFLYLLFTHTPIPTLELVRQKKEKGTYFGPFLQRTQARGVHRFLVETFRLFLCNKKIDNGCLDYHIGRCAGSCLATFNNTDYLFRLDLAKRALGKDRTTFLKAIDEKIQEYANNQEYEKAKHVHAYRQNVETIFATLHVHYADDKYLRELFAATNPAPGIADDYAAAQKQLQTELGFDRSISTIDCFDISHFQGHYIVGSCIRYTNGVPDKNMFRKFNIRSLTNQNDYAALQEIVSRRYKNPEDIPDLVLIDGGKGQRNAIKAVLPRAVVVSLAKREERLFSDAHPEGTVLDMHTPVGKLLIGLRDYAHHFAIHHHRFRRSSKGQSKAVL